MTDSVKLVIPGEPFAKQSMRVGIHQSSKGSFIRKYQPKKIVNAENYIKLFCNENLPKDFVPFNEALEAEVLFVFSPLKSFTKKKMKQLQSGITIYKQTKPDITDNLMKGLFDALESILFVNDSQIAKTKASKIYGLQPRTEIFIKPIKE